MNKNDKVLRLGCSIIIGFLAAIMLGWILYLCVTAAGGTTRDLVTILMFTWSCYSFAIYAASD